MALAACACAIVACGGGGGGGGGAPSGGGNGSGNPGGGASVIITGKAEFEAPLPVPNCNGLNLDAPELKPIRQATIQLLDAGTSAVLDQTVTDDNGDFELSVASNTTAFIRVRAELKRTGGPSWDVDVRDNVTSVGLPLEQRPLYVLDGNAFNTGSADQVRDLVATTGWGGSSYTATRAAAPFAILDAVYSGMLLVLSEDPLVNFEPLDIYWSVNNTATAGQAQDIDAGELGTSFYRSDNKLFLLGKDGVDTEEFDRHVIVHEWGHYFEDTMSRSDSIGGAHALGDRLDMRVAFGEGFATAYSGMALASALYCDTLGPAQASGFGIDIEGQSAGTPGWFNEISVMKLVYDLWDEADDGADSGSVGFGPIFSVMTDAQAVTPAFTSIFSFAEALKAENPASVPLIDALLHEQNIVAAGLDAYGGGETNDGLSGAGDVLPVYTTVVPDGSTINICSNSQFDGHADGNKLSEHRFLRMTIDMPSAYTFSIVTTTAIPWPDDPDDDRDQSDPDILIVRSGVVQNQVVSGDLQGFSGEANQEIFTTASALPAGDYVMAVVEFRYQDEDSPSDYPERTCFDITVTPSP